MGISTDVVVIGGGAAGLAAAFTARRRGASVVLVERDRLGGECTWTGCVPSKTLIQQARKVHGARQMGLWGEIDFGGVMEHVQEQVLKVFAEEDRPALESSGIRVLEGQATFAGPKRLLVDGTPLTGRVIVLATGSRPLIPPVPGLAEAEPLTNETVFDLRRLPARLAVVGGGAVGLELAQAFSRLGSEVTIVDALDRVATEEEPETSEAIAQVLTGEGVRLVLGSPVARVTRGPDGLALHTGDGTAVAADAVLCAAGRSPSTDGLEPTRGGVELDERGFVVADDKLRTTADGVYAAGDICGRLMYTHAGYAMGSLAVENGLGRLQRSFDDRVLPHATFTDPEVGRVGLTEAGAHAEFGDAARVAYLPIAETDRAKTSGDVVGFVKLIAGPHPVARGLAGGQLLGGTVVCPTGGDVVHELALAMRTRTVTGRLAQAVHAYPTWSLAIRECAVQFFTSYKGRSARVARPAEG